MSEFDANMIWALIPAAGHGKRMDEGMPKQYRLLDGWPVILHTLDRLARHPRISGFTVCLAPDDCCWASMPAALDKPLNTCAGGELRMQSVLRGLQAMRAAGEDQGYVLVHDAVRPCLPAECLDAVIDAGTRDDHGALLALPIAETIKRVTDSGQLSKAPEMLPEPTSDNLRCVTETVNRDGLWLAQTPQVFKAGLLLDALEQHLDDSGSIVDEAAAMEAAGYQPHVVLGSPANFKITFEADLALARRLRETGS